MEKCNECYHYNRGMNGEDGFSYELESCKYSYDTTENGRFKRVFPIDTGCFVPMSEVNNIRERNRVKMMEEISEYVSNYNKK